MLWVVSMSKTESERIRKGKRNPVARKITLYWKCFYEWKELDDENPLIIAVNYNLSQLEATRGICCIPTYCEDDFL